MSFRSLGGLRKCQRRAAAVYNLAAGAWRMTLGVATEAHQRIGSLHILL